MNLVALPTHWRLHHTTTARHPRTTFPITHCTDVTQLIALITQLIALITNCTDHTLYIGLGLPLSHCRVLFATANIAERFPYVFSCWLPGPFTLIWPFAACLLTLPVFWIFSLSAACPDLCIVPVYVSALPTLLLTELCLSDPLLSNKAAPGSLRYWHFITEYSATRGSSGFLRLPSPNMNPVDQLLHLRQGCLSIEEYVHRFCELSYQVPLYDEVLFKDLFHFGISEPIKSLFPGGEFNGSLRESMDHALLLGGSTFSVGEAEPLPKMATIPEPRQGTADIPESGHITAVHPESRHVTADLPEPRHVTAVHPESRHVTAVHPESRHIAGHPESRHVTAGHPETCHVLSVTPRHSRSVLRVPSLVSSVRDAPLVSAHAAGIPKPTHTNPLGPELIPPFQELTESAPELIPPSQELTESAPEPAPFQELTESAPEPAPSQELTESAPPEGPLELVPSSSPSSPLVPPSSPSSPLVPSSSPSSPLVPPSSPSSPLAPSSSPSPLVPSRSALSEHPLASVPPERPQASVPPERPQASTLPERPPPPHSPLPRLWISPRKLFWGGAPAYRPTESPDPPEFPDPSGLPDSPDLPWPPEFPACSVTNLVALSTHWRLYHTTTASHPRTSFPITHCTDVTQLIALITQLIALITHSI